MWLRSDGRVERKGGYRHTDSWHEWLQDNFYGGSATKRIVIKEPSFYRLASEAEACSSALTTDKNSDIEETKYAKQTVIVSSDSA